MKPIVIVALLGGTALAAGTGPEVGVRLDYGVTYGKADAKQQNDLSYGVPGIFELHADAGVRIAPPFYVGAYVGYGIGLTDHCGSGASCSANIVRVGGTAAFHFMPHRMWDPWVGIGMGYEWGNESATSNFGNSSSSAHGFELFHAEAGVDARVAHGFRAGLFAEATVTQYDHETGSFGGFSASGDVTDKATHGFVMIGVRAAFLP